MNVALGVGEKVWSKNVWRNKQNDRGAEVREMFKKLSAVSLETEKIRKKGRNHW